MKIFLIKIFSFICAVLLLCESIFLFAIRFRWIHVEKVISFYIFVVRTPEALSVTLGLAIGLLCAGIIFLAIALHRTKKEKMILINQDGELLRIPVDIIRDFTEQILSQDSHMGEFDISIRNKKSSLFIGVSPVLNGNGSVCRQVGELRRVLKEKIKNTFELTNCNVSFYLKGVRADSSVKELIGGDEDVAEVNMDRVLPRERVTEEESLEKKAVTKAPWSLFR